MKCAIAITQNCNLACDYCYIDKENNVMTLTTAKKIIDFIFNKSQENEEIEIGFFGGEPLLEFNLIKKITDVIHNHPSYDSARTEVSVVTNGTIMSNEIIDFLEQKKIGIGISCDGPSRIQDSHRRFPDGRGSSKIVEKNIKKAIHHFPFMPVNSVFSPENLDSLPDVIDYFDNLGVKNIYLNHNISADWSEKDAIILPKIFNSLAEKYMGFYKNEDPKYISIIDSKIAVILRGGYKPQEMCRMGLHEFGFAPTGNIYPCERLIGSDDGIRHCIGNINIGMKTYNASLTDPNFVTNEECQECTLNKYCMNWCGCTNYYSTKNYNRVGPFTCALEKAAISAAYKVINTLSEEGLHFSDHLAGTPLMSIIGEVVKDKKRILNCLHRYTYHLTGFVNKLNKLYMIKYEFI